MVLEKQLQEDHYVKIGEINTRYREMGTGDPPVFLIHGLGGYIENWELNVPAISQTRRVFALDLVGFGRSDKPEAEYSVPYFAEFVKDFMTSQGVERAVLIGESMGGAIALRVAMKYPHMVEKLVLTASAGFGKELSIMLRMMSLPFLGEYLSRPSRAGLAQLYSQLVHNKELITDELIDDAYKLSILPHAQQSLLKTTRALCNFWGVKQAVYNPILDRLDTIAAPSLVIWGKEDQILPVAHAHKATRGLPNVKLKVFDDCGHIPNIECAAAYNAAVLDFLAEG